MNQSGYLPYVGGPYDGRLMPAPHPPHRKIYYEASVPPTAEQTKQLVDWLYDDSEPKPILACRWLCYQLEGNRMVFIGYHR